VGVIQPFVLARFFIDGWGDVDFSTFILLKAKLFMICTAVFFKELFLLLLLLVFSFEIPNGSSLLILLGLPRCSREFFRRFFFHFLNLLGGL